MAAYRAVVEKLSGAKGAACERGVPFDCAQGRLSTAFGFRLTPLRMTVLISLQPVEASPYYAAKVSWHKPGEVP